MSIDGARFYGQREIVERFALESGWQHPGEAVVLQSLAALVRSKRILDVGVGAGRTIPLLMLLSDQYVGIDYAATMVEAARESFPGVDLRVGDARDLNEFVDGSFDFVFFSYNGIDNVEEADRRSVLESVYRVLDEDGLFAFSTLNRDGRTFRETPFQLHRPGLPWDRRVGAAARLVFRNVQDPHRVSRRIRNWREVRKQYVDHPGWSTSALAVSDFTLVNHFTTIPRLREELKEVGFEVVGVYGSDTTTGPLPGDVTTTDDDSLYAVARRSGR